MENIVWLLPKARIVDSTELMDRVRWIKTHEEVVALEPHIGYWRLQDMVCWSPVTPPGCCRLSSVPTRCW